MTKRRNLTGDLNKSPLKEKSPLREIIKQNEHLTFDEIEKVRTNIIHAVSVLTCPRSSYNRPTRKSD